MSGHTPGPWVASDWVVRGGNPSTLICDAGVGRDLRDEDLANARLIAAAPDMAREMGEAIKRLELMYQNAAIPYHVHKELVHVTNLLRDALAKAGA